ncbi:MAG TPA: cytochrome c biogenesis protein CcdA [Limnochordales bacterium]
MVPEQVTFPLAFVAGLVSFVSPCVLPLIPAYVTFLAGAGLEGLEADDPARRRRLVLNGVFFVLGFSAVFVAMGLGASALGRFLVGNLPILRRVGGLVVIAFGLYMMGVLRVLFLDRERRVQAPVRSPGPLNSLLLGATFAAGWTPCIGPVLASVLVLAGTAATATQGGLLLLTYAAGLAVPFLVVTLSLDRMRTVLRRLLPYSERIRFASGALLVVLGVMLYTNTFVLLNSYFNWGL